MFETPHLRLPLLAAAQAQKHVTVNEALSRLDALAQLAVDSRSLGAPPDSPAEGARHLVPSGAEGAWSGRDGALALFLNGGWEFLSPVEGWRLWVVDERKTLRRDGAGWVEEAAPGLLASGPWGLALSAECLGFEQDLSSGTVVRSALEVPRGSIVLGASARVVETVVGPSAWALGFDDAPTLFGGSIGGALDDRRRYALPNPTAYYADNPLRFEAVDAPFESGRVRVGVYYLSITIPDPA